MKKTEYERWLQEQKYQANTITAQLHRAGRVEECYGDLDEHFKTDQLESIIIELAYTTDDKRRNRPNQTKIPFQGDPYGNLASYRDAVKRYRNFKLSVTDGYAPVDVVVKELQSATEKETGQRIGLERDMQAALRLRIEQLEQGLRIIDEGIERSVDSGFIDITAQDAAGMTVVIELKTGVAGQRAIAQILSYMGDIADEHEDNKVRGILVAAEFDSKAKAAARMVPNLSLQKYSVHFEFSEGKS